MLGLARSGRAAVGALQGPRGGCGGVRPRHRRRRRMIWTLTCASATGTTPCWKASGSSIKSPGVPADADTGGGSARARHPGQVGDRARRATAPEPAARCHRHEREDDDDGPARGDPRGRRCAGRGGREHRPAADLARRRRRRRCLGRVRAVVVPARGRRDASTAGRGAPQPRAGPHRPPRRLRRVRRRQAARRSRTRSRDDVAVVPRGFGPSPAPAGGSSSQATTRFRPSRSSPAPTTARTPPPRPRPHGRSGSRTTRSPRR